MAMRESIFSSKLEVGDGADSDGVSCVRVASAYVRGFGCIRADVEDAAGVGSGVA
jgi:hypothetical protein